MDVYEVFMQRRAEDPATHVGSVRAGTLRLALQAAKDVYTRRDHCYRLMVTPRSAMLSTSDEDADLFAIAYEKEYRRPEFFTRKWAGKPLGHEATEVGPEQGR